MKLNVVEDVTLSDELTYFGTVVFDDGNIVDKHRKTVIRNAKRGTVYLDPRVSYERSIGTKRTTLAHECFHWHRHQPYHVLMKMIGAEDNLGKAIQCTISGNTADSDKWKAVDWMEWQAKGIAPKILMPEKTVRPLTEDLIREYSDNGNATVAIFERIIDDLSETYDVSRQAAKVRLVELGYSRAEGAYPFVNGRYVSGYNFDTDVLENGQTFTVPFADVIKAYCYDRDFRKLIDTDAVRYIDGHVCLNNDRYISFGSDGNASLSQYALNHIDECCIIFTRGYSYQSKYQGLKNYAFFMRNAAPQEDQIEFSFEMNKHNKTLLSQIQNARKSASLMQKYPGAFSETLVQLMKDKKMSAKTLADGSLVGEKTIQRLRNNEEYPTTKQTVMGLCYGLKLTIPEAEMLISKTDFNLKPTTPENNAYRCTLGSCADISIYEVNEMLEANGYKPF